MKVFKKKIFFEKYPKAVDDIAWVEMCDGKEVIDDRIICHNSFGEEMIFLIDDSWCEEI